MGGGHKPRDIVSAYRGNEFRAYRIPDGNQVIGTASVLRDGDDAELGLMFVDPSAIGGGIGRALFDEAVKLARRLGYRRMTILADVNAAPFYERMGARFLRRMPSDAIPGRTLPFYEYDLAERAS